jgi:hypothetical protein
MSVFVPASFVVDTAERTIVANYLLHPDWDGGRLAGKYGSVVAFLARYSPELKNIGKEAETYRFVFRPYDWRLDDWRVEYYAP